MKTPFIITLSIMLSIAVNAQTYITQVKTTDEKSWGYINQNGETISAPIYKKCYPFSEDGLAPILESKQYSFIDTKGEIVETELNGFQLQKGFIGFGGLQGYYNGMAAVMKDKKWGFLDTKGKLVIQLKYDKVSTFNEGFATAKNGDDFFVITKAGNEIRIQAPDIYEIKRFSEGLAPFTNAKKESGFINTNGEIAIPAQFITVGYFIHGLAWAKDEEKKVGFINKSGDWIINPQFDAAKRFDPTSGLARIKIDGEWAYVNNVGEIVNIDDTEAWGDFNDGLARGKKGGKVGYYNNKGEWIIEPEFDGGRNFKNGFIAVKKDNKWGFIDQTGKWIIEPQYEAVKDMEKVN